MTKKNIEIQSCMVDFDGHSLGHVKLQIDNWIETYGSGTTLQYYSAYEGDSRCYVLGFRPETDEEYATRLAKEEAEAADQAAKVAQHLISAKQQRYMQYLALRMEFDPPKD